MNKSELRQLEPLEEAYVISKCALISAQAKIDRLEQAVDEGREGNKLTRPAFKALTQLEDAYLALSAVRGEHNRCERVLKNKLFEIHMEYSPYG